MTINTPRPVTTWENDAVNGLALCYEDGFRAEIDRAQQLRDQMAEYRKSLPTDFESAVKAALKVMHPKGDSYPAGFEELLHLTFALDAMIEQGDICDRGPTRDAAKYLSLRLVTCAMKAQAEWDAISDLLENPNRLKRESQSA
ncbi:MAG: hypothetical protein ABJ375_13230 [Rhizobiaceae bacterium]